MKRALGITADVIILAAGVWAIVVVCWGPLGFLLGVLK